MTTVSLARARKARGSQEQAAALTLDLRAPVRQTCAMTENDKVRRYLVVTDHALDDQQLAATVQQSLAAEPCQFYLLVLATPAGTKDRVLWAP
jgi:hypothetical protein